MINKVYNNSYKLFNQVSIPIFSSSCVSSNKEKYENIILLQNPQLISNSDISNMTYDLIPSTLPLNTGFIDINNRKPKQNLNAVSKFDKKHRNTFVSDDGNNIKKSKLVNKKKKQSKITIDQDDFFLNNKNVSTQVHNLHSDIVKPIKSKKQKKKQRLQDRIPDHHLDVNKHYSLDDYSNSQEKSLYTSKTVVLDMPITLQQLANKLNVSEASIITWLFLQGISVTVNQMIDLAIASKVAQYYDFTIVEADDYQSKNSTDSRLSINNSEQTVRRAPIVTVFGHVDHGKTTLLDFVQKTNIANQEVGGITQSIKAYEISYNYLDSNQKIVFLDTPGHEAFTSMRLKGIEVTDIAILLVAADDGLKPQSIEAIRHIISRQLPYIVAINKMDKSDINIEKVKSQLADYNIIDKESGGQSSIVYISALTGLHIDTLLSEICALSKLLNLKTSLQSYAEGIIIESYLDKKIGPIAIVVIKKGTLHIGDIVVAGRTYGKVKLIISSQGNKIDLAESSAVVRICGFASIPLTGLKFYAVSNEKSAKNKVNNYINTQYHYENTNLLNNRITLKSCNRDISLKQINLILKADTQGSIEAIINACSQIPQDKVQINIISHTLGSVFEKDIDLALTSQSLILGFNINIMPSISSIADKLKVTVKKFNIIYDLIDYLKQYMLKLVKPEYDKIVTGQATVQTVFYINKGAVAGCLVNSGILKQGSYIIVRRNHDIVYEGILNSLKQLKNNVKEVAEGSECGVMCMNYHLWQKMDQIEAFDMIEKEKIL